MTEVGTHSRPIDGTVTANGRQLVPLAMLLQQRGDVSALPQPNDPARSGTAADAQTEPDKAGHRRPAGTAFIVVALFAVAQVAVVAFSGSWQHQYELSIHLGQAHWVAGMQPLSVEGLIVSASLVIWYAARYGYRKRDAWAAYLVLAAGIGQTVLMNLGADYRWPWLGPEISVWPAVAFVAAYEMAVWLVRKRQDGAAGARPGARPHVDKRADKQPGSPQDKRADKPAPPKTVQPRTKLDKAAAVIRDNPDVTDLRTLAALADVSTKTITRARNGTAKTP